MSYQIFVFWLMTKRRNKTHNFIPVPARLIFIEIPGKLFYIFSLYHFPHSTHQQNNNFCQITIVTRENRLIYRSSLHCSYLIPIHPVWYNEEIWGIFMMQRVVGLPPASDMLNGSLDKIYSFFFYSFSSRSRNEKIRGGVIGWRDSWIDHFASDIPRIYIFFRWDFGISHIFLRNFGIFLICCWYYVIFLIFAYISGFSFAFKYPVFRYHRFWSPIIRPVRIF